MLVVSIIELLDCFIVMMLVSIVSALLVPLLIVLLLDDDECRDEFWRGDVLGTLDALLVAVYSGEVRFVRFVMAPLVVSLGSFDEVPLELAAILAETRIAVDCFEFPKPTLPLPDDEEKLEVRLTIVLCGLILSNVPLMNSSILS